MSADRAPREDYVERFDTGPNGWCGWRRQGEDRELAVVDGALQINGPWGVDAYHAPPGGGYLALVTYLHTDARYVREFAKPNRFVAGGHSRDLTGATLAVRIRGQLHSRGADLVLLAQASVDGTVTNHVLVGQPIRVGADWSEQSIVLEPDPAQWRCLGARHDMAEYGYADIARVLADVNVDLILVHYPLTVVPLVPTDDIHRLRPEQDYAIDERYLPSGNIEIDTISIRYP